MRTAAPTRRPTVTPLPIALRTMVPGFICTISIRFTPRARGVRRASLVIGDNGASGAWEVLLRGRGIKQRGRPT